MLKADTSEPVKRPCRNVPTDLETGTAIYNATVQRKGSLDNDCTAPPSVTCSSVLQGTVILGAGCKSVNRGVKGHSAHVIRPQNVQLRHLEARFQSVREHPTADSVDLASHRTFATDS